MSLDTPTSVERFLGIWYATQRRIDLKYLWPAIYAKATSLDDAKAAFAAHTFHSKAWRQMDGDLFAVIDTLEVPR